MSLYELVLLRIINDNSSLSFLTKRGLTYAQIAGMFKNLHDSGYIISNEEGYRVTEAGELLLRDELKKQRRSLKDIWILPQDRYYCKQLPINQISELPAIRDLKQ